MIRTCGRSLRAHATQIDPNEPWWFGLDDEELAEVYPYEDWVLAATAIDDFDVSQWGNGSYETDLFIGVHASTPAVTA